MVVLLLFHNLALEEGGEGKGIFFHKMWAVVHPGCLLWIVAVSAPTGPSRPFGGSWLTFP